MTRWRYITPVKRGRWCETKAQAEDAAVRSGEGTRDAYVNGRGVKRFYPSPLTRIESEGT